MTLPQKTLRRKKQYHNIYLFIFKQYNMMTMLIEQYILPNNVYGMQHSSFGFRLYNYAQLFLY